jgi:hypothetical protein
MLDSEPCRVATADELDKKIREIFALDHVGRSDQICGTLHVYYSDESVKQAHNIAVLENRGVRIEWHKEV